MKLRFSAGTILFASCVFLSFVGALTIAVSITSSFNVIAVFWTVLLAAELCAIGYVVFRRVVLDERIRTLDVPTKLWKLRVPLLDITSFFVGDERAIQQHAARYDEVTRARIEKVDAGLRRPGGTYASSGLGLSGSLAVNAAGTVINPWIKKMAQAVPFIIIETKAGTYMIQGTLYRYSEFYRLGEKLRSMGVNVLNPVQEVSQDPHATRHELSETLKMLVIGLVLFFGPLTLLIGGLLIWSHFSG